jgi:D-glycero-D-manno-heptose 1,7-bisphosphate phosphatase
MRRAVFLDRDGTVIEQVHHIRDPRDVRLIDGAAEALRRLRDAGFACVLVSNQSAVGRGIATLDDVAAVQAETERQLRAAGAAVDGWYFCPVAPSERAEGDRTVVEHPDRKPGPGLLLRAARELSIDLAASWMIGDMASDVLAGKNAGVRGTVLVRTGHGADADAGAAGPDRVARDLRDAAQWILAESDSYAREQR